MSHEIRKLVPASRRGKPWVVISLLGILAVLSVMAWTKLLMESEWSLLGAAIYGPLTLWSTAYALKLALSKPLQEPNLTRLHELRDNDFQVESQPHTWFGPRINDNLLVHGPDQHKRSWPPDK
jgi:hypothetical protein